MPYARNAACASLSLMLTTFHAEGLGHTMLFGGNLTMNRSTKAPRRPDIVTGYIAVSFVITLLTGIVTITLGVLWALATLASMAWENMT